jgi:hypothetical protein
MFFYKKIYSIIYFKSFIWYNIYVKILANKEFLMNNKESNNINFKDPKQRESYLNEFKQRGADNLKNELRQLYEAGVIDKNGRPNK